MTKKEVEYTVMSIDKTKRQKGLLNACIWFNRAGAVYLVYTAITMAAATSLSLGTLGLLAVGLGLYKLSRKTVDLAFDKKNQIYDMKKTITYDQYKTYHSPSKLAKQFSKIKSKFKK